MVAGLALGIDAADIAAGIFALLLEAHFSTGAICVKDTLRPTVGRSSEVAWQTGTLLAVAVSGHLASGMRATGRGNAQLRWLRH